MYLLRSYLKELLFFPAKNKTLTRPFLAQNSWQQPRIEDDVSFSRKKLFAISWTLNMLALLIVISSVACLRPYVAIHCVGYLAKKLLLYRHMISPYRQNVEERSRDACPVWIFLRGRIWSVHTGGEQKVSNSACLRSVLSFWKMPVAVRSTMSNCHKGFYRNWKTIIDFGSRPLF